MNALQRTDVPHRVPGAIRTAAAEAPEFNLTRPAVRCVECDDMHPVSWCPECGACDFQPESSPCWNCGATA